MYSITSLIRPLVGEPKTGLGSKLVSEACYGPCTNVSTYRNMLNTVQFKASLAGLEHDSIYVVHKNHKCVKWASLQGAGTECVGEHIKTLLYVGITVWLVKHDPLHLIEQGIWKLQLQQGMRVSLQSVEVFAVKGSRKKNMHNVSSVHSYKHDKYNHWQPVNWSKSKP